MVGIDLEEVFYRYQKLDEIDVPEAISSTHDLATPEIGRTIKENFAFHIKINLHSIKLLKKKVTEKQMIIRFTMHALILNSDKIFLPDNFQKEIQRDNLFHPKTRKKQNLPRY